MNAIAADNIGRAVLASALADFRDSVPWTGTQTDNVRNAVRRSVSGNLGLVLQVTPLLLLSREGRTAW